MRDNLKTKNIKGKENSIRKDCILMKEALPITWNTVKDKYYSNVVINS